MTYWQGIKQCWLINPITGSRSHKSSVFQTSFSSKDLQTNRRARNTWGWTLLSVAFEPRHTSPSQFITAQSTGTFCIGKPKLHLPRRQRERNMVSGFPWNIQMLLIFISQVIPTSWHLVRRFLTCSGTEVIYDSSLSTWPLSPLLQLACGAI